MATRSSILALENPHGQRSLVGYGLQGHKEWDTTERLSTAHNSPVLSACWPALQVFRFLPSYLLRTVAVPEVFSLLDALAGTGFHHRGPMFLFLCFPPLRNSDTAGSCLQIFLVFPRFDLQCPHMPWLPHGLVWICNKNLAFQSQGPSSQFPS